MRLLKALLAILFGLSIAVAALPWWLPTGWIRARIEREAAAALGTPVAIEKLSLFWTGAELRGLTVAEILTVDRARVSAPLTKLLGGRLEGIDIRIENPSLRLERGPEGTWNVARLGAPAGPGESEPEAGRPPAAPPRLEGNLRIDGATVRIEEGTSSRVLSIPRLAIAFTPEGGTGTATSVTLALEAAIPPSLGGGTSKIDAVATVGMPGPIEIRSLALSVPGGAVAATGRIDPAAAGGAAYAFEARISASLGRLAESAGLPLPSGELSQTLALSGSPAEVAVRLDGHVADLAHAFLRWPPARFEDALRIRWVPETRLLELPELKLTLAPPGLTVEARGTVAGPGEEGFARSVDLTLSARLDSREAVEAGGLSLSADVLSGSARLSGTPEAIALEASGTGRNMRLSGTDLAFPLALPTLEIEQKARLFPLEKRIEIESCLLKTGFLTFRARPGSIGWGESASLALAFRLEGDLDETSRWTEALVPWPGALPQPLGTYAADLEVTGSPSACAFRSDLVWDKAACRWKDGRRLDLGGTLKAAVAGKVSSAPSRSLALDSLSFALVDPGRTDLPARASVSAEEVRLSEEGGLRAVRPIRLQLQDLSVLPALLAGAGLLPGAPSLSGKLSVSADGVEIDGAGSGKARLAIDGTRLSARPEGGPSASLGALQATAGVSFQARDASFSVSDLSLEGTGLSFAAAGLSASGAIRAHDLSLASAAGRLESRGSLDFSGLDLTFGEPQAPSFRTEGKPWDVAWEAAGSPADGWDLRSFSLRTPAGTLKGSARLPTGPDGALQAALEESHIDLAHLAKNIPSLEAFRASGGVTVGGSFARDAKGLAGRATCRLEKARFSQAGGSPVLLDGTVAYAVDPSGDRLSSEGLSVEADGQKGTVSLDLSGLAGAGGPPLASLLSLSGTARLGLPLYAFQKNEVKDIACDLDFGKDGVARLSAKALVNRGAFSAEAQVRAQGDHQMRLVLDKADLDVSDARLLALALPFIPAAGGRAAFTLHTDSRFSASGLDVTGFLDTLRTPGVQKIRLADGFVEGSLLMGALADKLRMVDLAKIRFTSVEQDYEVKDRRIVNHLTRVEGDIPLEIRGWTAFDGTMEHRILMTGRLAEGETQSARILRALNAAGGIRAHGNVAAPSVDVDYDKLAAKLLEEGAKEKGLEILEDLFKKKRR